MLIGPTKSEGVTPLMVAAQIGDITTIIKLVKAGENIDEIDSLGQTALMHAVLFGETQAIKTFITLGANMAIRDVKGNTAFHLALTDVNCFLEQALIDATVLALEASNGKNRYFDSESKNLEGETPLESLNSMEILPHLINKRQKELKEHALYCLVGLLFAHNIPEYVPFKGHKKSRQEPSAKDIEFKKGINILFDTRNMPVDVQCKILNYVSSSPLTFTKLEYEKSKRIADCVAEKSFKIAPK